MDNVEAICVGLNNAVGVSSERNSWDFVCINGVEISYTAGNLRERIPPKFVFTKTTRGWFQSIIKVETFEISRNELLDDLGLWYKLCYNLDMALCKLDQNKRKSK